MMRTNLLRKDKKLKRNKRRAKSPHHRALRPFHSLPTKNLACVLRLELGEEITSGGATGCAASSMLHPLVFVTVGGSFGFWGFWCFWASTRVFSFSLDGYRQGGVCITVG